MSIWNKLLEADVKDKKKFQQIFAETIQSIRNGNFSLNAGEMEKTDHFIIVEDNRLGSYYRLFKELQQKAPDKFLGFSVLAGMCHNKEVRVSCFGVPCNVLGKALFKKK